jgi:hypothetical protein
MTKEEALALFDAHEVFIKKPRPKLGSKEFDAWHDAHEKFHAQIQAALKEYPNIEVPPPVIRGKFVPAQLITNEPTSPSE